MLQKYSEPQQDNFASVQAVSRLALVLCKDAPCGGSWGPVCSLLNFNIFVASVCCDPPAQHATPRDNQYEPVLRCHRWWVQDGSEELSVHPHPRERAFHTSWMQRKHQWVRHLFATIATINYSLLVLLLLTVSIKVCYSRSSTSISPFSVTTACPCKQTHSMSVNTVD